MTAEQERAVKMAINLVVTAISLAVMVSIAYPELGEQLRRGGQWLRYWRWVATRTRAPRWVDLLSRPDLPDEVAL